MGIAERKEREKEKRRQDIIESAEKVFFSKGIENATMDEVAEKAELSKGTLYLYFKNKEALQFAIAIKGAEMLMQSFKNIINKQKSGLENLLDIGREFISFSRNNPDYFNMFMQFQGANALPKMNQEETARYFREQSPMAFVVEIVKEGINDRSLRDDIPAGLLATTLWSQMLGVMQVISNKKEIHSLFNIKPGEILQTHFELVLNGAKKSEKISWNAEQQNSKTYC